MNMAVLVVVILVVIQVGIIMVVVMVGKVAVHTTAVPIKVMKAVLITAMGKQL